MLRIAEDKNVPAKMIWKGFKTTPTIFAPKIYFYNFLKPETLINTVLNVLVCFSR